MGIKKSIKNKLRSILGIVSPMPKRTLISSSKFLSVGRNSYHNGSFFIKGKKEKVEIGSFCALGQNIKLITSNHNYNYLSIQYSLYNELFKEKPYKVKISKEPIILIGNDVWIGDNVLILPNVNIGDGAIIAAGSVVTKSVLPYTIVAGVPATKIKDRFRDDVKKELLDLKWWDWSDLKIKNNKELFFKNFND